MGSSGVLLPPPDMEHALGRDAYARLWRYGEDWLQPTADLGWPPLYQLVKSAFIHERKDSLLMEPRQKPWARQSLAV